MVNLKAEDVDYIEFVCLDRIEAPYRRYEDGEIQEVTDLFRANHCYEYEYSALWPGFFSKEFHIMMKDGTAHTVCSIYSTITVINGAAFGTFSDWLQDWPEFGDGPLLDNWEEMKASRNYVHPENEVSILRTSSHDAQRNTLDYEYDTDVKMCSVSRRYEIGRNWVELSATDASPTELTLHANWPGFPDGAQLKTKAQYFLERWQENPADGTKGYAVMNTDRLILAPEQQLLSGDTVCWDINWVDSYGSLEPGYYRIGMIIYEGTGGTGQNETIVYAKFSLADRAQS